MLFADICNFTELSSRIEAFPMVAQLNHLFSMWDLMVEKHHLEKIKTYVFLFITITSFLAANSSLL